MANCERPKCAAFEFGKCHFQSNKVNTIKKNLMKDQELSKDHLRTGNMVYEDQYISLASSRLYQTKGKSYPYDMFS